MQGWLFMKNQFECEPKFFSVCEKFYKLATSRDIDLMEVPTEIGGEWDALNLTDAEAMAAIYPVLEGTSESPCAQGSAFTEYFSGMTFMAALEMQKAALNWARENLTDEQVSSLEDYLDNEMG
jgi:hypothetical protein